MYHVCSVLLPSHEPLYMYMSINVCFWQVAGDRDELLQQLTELQQQKQDITGESQQMSLKYDNTQREVHTHFIDIVSSAFYLDTLLCNIPRRHLLNVSCCSQLTQALKEIEELNLQLVASKESWEHEKLRLQEDM